MISRYDMYGFETLSLEEALQVVEEALGLSLEERDSSYYAGTYYGYRLGSGRGVRLYKNRDPNTGANVRSAYADYALLMEIDDMPEMDAIAERLSEAKYPPRLLRSVTRTNDEEPDDAQ